jgi:hypothetical protein
MTFLTDTDFKGILGSNTLSALRGTDDEDIDTAESHAISELSVLEGNYNITSDLAASDDARNVELIRILVHLTAYYLYNTSEAIDIPDRIDTNYSNIRRDLAKIASGSLHTTLTPLYDSESKAKSNYRFGGDAPRDNNIF